MLKRIHKTISEFEKISYRLAKYGVLLACALLAACAILQYRNNHSAEYSITLHNNVRMYGEVCVAIFAEAIIGSLLFDYNAKKVKGRGM